MLGVSVRISVRVSSNMRSGKDISLRIRKIFIDLEKVEKALGKQKSTDNLDTDSIFGDQSFSQNNSLMEFFQGLLN